MKNMLMRRIRCLLFACVTASSLFALLVLNIGSVHAAHPTGKGALPLDCPGVAVDNVQNSTGTAGIELIWSQHCHGKSEMVVSAASTQKTSMSIVVTSTSIFFNDAHNYDGPVTTNVLTTSAIEPHDSNFYPTFRACVYIHGQAPLCTNDHNSNDGSLYIINNLE